MPDCNPLLGGITCAGDVAVDAIVGGAIEDMANAMVEGLGKIVASLGTVWVFLPTPNMTDSAGPGAANTIVPAEVSTLLNNIMWISLVVCVIALMVAAALMMVKMRRGEGFTSFGRMGLILVAVVIISGSGAMITALLPNGPVGVGGTAAFIQGSTWYIMLAVAVGSTIVGAARMAITMRGEAGRDLFFALLRMVFVSAAAVGFVGLMIQAADSFSIRIINEATNCDLTQENGACFGRNIGQMLGLVGSSPIGAILIIILGAIALLLSFGQIVLMIARSAMLVILTGTLPLSAAAGMSGEAGRTWLNRNIAWLLAFLLYKPVAAIVYAAAFNMAGADLFRDDGSGLITIITGMMMMLLALIAMPALMKFVTPMVGSMSGGASGGALVAAAIPMGAAGMGRLMGGGGSGGGGSAAPTGMGAGGTAPGAQGHAGPAGQSGSTSQPSAKPDAGGADAAGKAASSSGAGTAATAGAGTAGGGAAAAGGGAAASGAGAGAAAGPWGAAAGAAVSAAKGAAEQGVKSAQQLGDNAIGDGPSGNG